MPTHFFGLGVLLASSLAVMSTAFLSAASASATSPSVAAPSGASPATAPPAAVTPAAPAGTSRTATQAPARRWIELSVGLNASSVGVSHAEMPGTNRGFGKGFVVNAAFSPARPVALVAEVWWLSTSFDLCIADAACFNYLAEDQTRFTAGVRLHVLPFFYLQGAAGVVGSATRYDDLLWSPVLVGLAAFHYPTGPVELGVDLRASTMSESGASISTIGASALVSKSW